MSFGWQLFRIICFLQLLATTFFAFISMISLFETGRIYFLLQTLFFCAMAALAILALQLLSNNYPDKPVAGKQKSLFNWLFLVNFLLLAFLFGLVFSSYRSMKEIAAAFDHDVFSLPFKILIRFFANLAVLVFQFAILYGLYQFRRQLYINLFMNKQFEFEAEKVS